jgi:hypothetical protein
LHVLSNLRAKQSIAPAKPTVHIAYTMKIGHAFEVSIVEVESSWMALQGIMHAADSGGSSATHTPTSDNDALFGVRAELVRARPQHHPSTSTMMLHATQLSYQTSSTADYVDVVSDVDMDEVVSSAAATTLSLFSNIKETKSHFRCRLLQNLSRSFFARISTFD